MSKARRSISGPKQWGTKQRGRLRQLRDTVDVAKSLRRRIADLEQEVQENRQLNRRIAELTDVVQELLLPPEQRDEGKLRSRLAGYDPGQ